MTTPITADQVEQFHQDGFLVVDSLFNPEETRRILEVAHTDPEIAAEAKENENFEGDGVTTRLVYRPTLGDNAYSAVASSRRLVGPMEQIYSSPMNHYYTLNMLKDPGTGGWEWHQDYGYHYKEFFYPHFISVMVALEPATKENGCLRVVKGSNQLGRLEHFNLGSQLIANRSRVDLALEQMEEVHCELSAGSVLYFDGNVLHASHPNHSQISRWSLVIAYAPTSNIWVREEESTLTKVTPLDDEQLEEAIRRHEAAVGG